MIENSTAGRIADSGPARILVVEDSPVQRQILKRGRRIGRDLMRDVVLGFCSEGSRKLGEMRLALEHQDAPTLARAAHFMAGSSAVLHVRSLSERFRELEASAGHGDFSGCAAQLECVERLFDRLETHLFRLSAN